MLLANTTTFSESKTSQTCYQTLPKLLPLDDPAFKDQHYGPTDTSNWLIPNRVLMSAYPGDSDAESSKKKIESFMKAGINCFVCFQPKDELVRFLPYRPFIQEYCYQHNNGTHPLPSFEEIEFLHLPIPDRFVTSDEVLMSFVQQELIPRVLNQQKRLLLHCWGGHGRTSTVSCVLISHLYQLSAQQALERVSRAHSCRKPARGRAPETPSQIKQVKKLAFGSSYNSDEEIDA